MSIRFSFPKYSVFIACFYIVSIILSIVGFLLKPSFSNWSVCLFNVLSMYFMVLNSIKWDGGLYGEV